MVFKPNPPKFKKTPKEKCLLSGGVWNEETQTCGKALKKEEKPIEVPKVTPPTPEVGEIINSPKQTVTLPDGRTFYGLNKEDVARLVQQQTEPKIPLGSEPAGTAQAQAEEQARLQQSIGQMGQVGQLTPTQEAPINWGQAMTAGTVGQIPSILATAGGFAAGGALVGGPVGALAGAGVGIIAGVTKGILANIKKQQKGEIGAAKEELSLGTFAMRQYAMQASRDPANADYWIKEYNKALTRVHQARVQTKLEVTGVLNSWMEDGREELAEFDDFLRPGGRADIYKDKLRVALNSGVPFEMNEEDFEFAESIE